MAIAKIAIMNNAPGGISNGPPSPAGGRMALVVLPLAPTFPMVKPRERIEKISNNRLIEFNPLISSDSQLY